MVKTLVFGNESKSSLTKQKYNMRHSQPIAVLYYALREKDEETIMGIGHKFLISTEDNLNEYINALDTKGAKVSAHYNFHNDFVYSGNRQRPLLNDDFEPIDNTVICWKGHKMLKDEKNNLNSLWFESCYIIDQDGDKLNFDSFYISGKQEDDWVVKFGTGKYEKAKKVKITYDNDGTILVKKNGYGTITTKRKTSRKIEIF